MFKKKSILFVCPDYHCSFILRDEFRRLGWRADIYVPWEYPEKLLYSNKDTHRPFRINRYSRIFDKLNTILSLIWFLCFFWRYRYHLYYGSPPSFSFLEEKLKLETIFGKGFLFSLFLSKLFGCKIIYLPTGCNNEETKQNIKRLDAGNVCGNCGVYDKCNDNKNNLNFTRVLRYADMCVGVGSLDSTKYSATHFKYKSIDLNLWKPGLDIPPEHLLPPTRNLRILHSFYNEGRENKGRNIKGSPFVLAAIERLRQEGHAVEYIYFNDKLSNQMRFYQAQADIVVEQLIYGCWGSTGVETMALGKPVVCYLRPAWKEFFLNSFPEYDELPVVEATTSNIYDVLKKLVVENEYRLLMGKKSRKFAEKHFDSKKNALAFADLLKKL